jgi:hypothetical protein
MDIIVSIAALTVIVFLALDAFGMLPEAEAKKVVEAKEAEPKVEMKKEAKPTTSTLRKAEAQSS